jgi:hypothetical protein
MRIVLDTYCESHHTIDHSMISYVVFKVKKEWQFVCPYLY